MSDSAISDAAPTWDRIRSRQASIVPRLVRERVVDSTRSFFKSRGFHEVETPLFVRCPGMEPYLDAFQTTWHSALGEHHPGFLTTSPEYAMKKILVAGLAPIFQICKSFRNGEEVSSRHNPEFTILEWYRTNADYTHLMVDCEELFRDIATGLRSEPVVSGGQFDISSAVGAHGRAPLPNSPAARPSDAGRATPVGAHGRAPTPNPPNSPFPPEAPTDRSAWTYQGQRIDLDGPWERLTVRESFQRYAGVDPIDNDENMVATARGKGYTADVSPTWEQAFHLIFLNDVEPCLGRGRPTFLYDYPISMAALSRPKPGDPAVAERFELYVAGIEMANAFSELTDPAEQLRRLRDEQGDRRALGKTVYDMDLDFIRALGRGLPPSAGIALGMDRLAMFFADVTTIRDVLWFPTDELFR